MSVLWLYSQNVPMISFIKLTMNRKRELSSVTVQYVVNNMNRALHISAKSGLARVVRELIQRGADLNAKDSDGRSNDCQ